MSAWGRRFIDLFGSKRIVLLFPDTDKRDKVSIIERKTLSK